MHKFNTLMICLGDKVPEHPFNTSKSFKDAELWLVLNDLAV